MSLESVMADITAIAAKPESGIKVSHNGAPESLGRTWPVSWLNPVDGSSDPSADFSYEHYRIELIVYVTPRLKDYPTETARLAPLVDSVKRTVRQAFEAGEIQGEVSQAWVSTWKAGIRRWGSDPWHSITFTVDVHEEVIDEE